MIRLFIHILRVYYAVPEGSGPDVIERVVSAPVDQKQTHIQTVNLAVAVDQRRTV